MLITADAPPTMSAAANKNVRKTQQKLEYKANRSSGMSVAQARAVANASQSIMRPASEAIADAAASTGLGSGGGGGGGRGGRGGGGGGGGGAAPAAPAVVLPDLNTYISQSDVLRGVEGENNRLLSDFDAQTGQQRAETAEDQRKRFGYLDDALDEAGTSNAESFASRGLGRSGLVMKAQQDIDAQGEQQRDSINQLMTNLLSSRASQRLQQIAQNRTNRQNAINQLTQNYNTLAAMPNVTTAS